MRGDFGSTQSIRFNDTLLSKEGTLSTYSYLTMICTRLGQTGTVSDANRTLLMVDDLLHGLPMLNVFDLVVRTITFQLLTRQVSDMWLRDTLSSESDRPSHWDNRVRTPRFRANHTLSVQILIAILARISSFRVLDIGV